MLNRSFRNTNKKSPDVCPDFFIAINVNKKATLNVALKFLEINF